MSTKYIDFAELKERVSIENVLTMLGVELAKRPNGQLRGVCPIHGGSDRGFVVTPSKGLWHCFSGCGGGDAIALVAKVRDLSVKDAAAEIQQHFENGNSTGNSDRTPERNSTVPDNRNRSIKPLDYLQADHETVKALGVESATAQAFGAGYAPKGIMRGRMAIPVYDRQGTLLAYCGRAVKGESPALIFPNGFRPEEHIFNAGSITAGELYLVRDPLDVLLAHQNGIENVVAFLTETMSAQQLEMLSGLMDEARCDTVELF